LVGLAARRRVADQNGDHFRDFAEAEINVIARMAPMTGIL
jgi:hypothetical protein